ncbi:hypothetical protein PF003_g26106 [Phytophthora fragariae]|nr:hypothetical protein PF003_g26106 [Phytophthora fragariae]
MVTRLKGGGNTLKVVQPTLTNSTKTSTNMNTSLLAVESSPSDALTPGVMGGLKPLYNRRSHWLGLLLEMKMIAKQKVSN